MFRRWINAVLRPLGIRLPFGGVICAEMAKRVVIEDDWRARILTQRTLIFTRTPEPGDLRDTYAIVPGSPIEAMLYDSADAMEVARRRPNPHTLEIEWLPRNPITRYALYRHDDAWTAPESYHKGALSAQYTCDMKTGVFLMEVTTPAYFEAGVLFRAPRWRRFRSERALMKYAIAQLQQPSAQKPQLEDQGHRAVWQIEGPRIGDRFLFVLFHEQALADWEARIEATSIVGRARKLWGDLAHGLGR